jgi:site-specific DNA-methyltransferase (adenine-specific)
MVNKILNGDCLEVMKDIDDNFIDMVLTDPPYGIDVLNSEWNYDKIERLKDKSNIGKVSESPVKGLPVGMKFNPDDAKKLGVFLNKCAVEWIRVLKPGGFCLVFSSARASHRVGVALEEAGFELRDQLIWNYGIGQCKAQGVQNFIRKSKMDNKEELISKLEGMKTPQLAPTFETIWLCQKPKEGTFIENWIKWGTGLVDFREGPKKVSFDFKKPLKEERDLAFNHPTLKPIELLMELIKIFSFEKSLILDSFCGSGSTCVAANKCNRNYIGIEKDISWYQKSIDRLDKISVLK